MNGRIWLAVLAVPAMAAADPKSPDPDVPDPTAYTPVTSLPPPPPPPTPFDQGRFGLGFGAGAQTQLGYKKYVVAGGGAYYVLDGVAVELGGAYSFGDGPSIARTTPGLRYVVQPLVGKFPLIPYVGAFYSHYFIGGDNADIDTAGSRVGLMYVSSNVVFGLGIVYERTISECVEIGTTECSSYYPDLTFSIAL